jgi:hypothetical protein
MSCLKSIKKNEGTDILNFTPRKKEESLNQIAPKGLPKIELPNNGREFFFSNVCMKIY